MISLALVANGNISPAHFHVPIWVVVTAASATGVGTYAGGWRIIRTLGARIIKMDPAQGFALQSAGAAVILTSSHFGLITLLAGCVLAMVGINRRVRISEPAGA